MPRTRCSIHFGCTCNCTYTPRVAPLDGIGQPLSHQLNRFCRFGLHLLCTFCDTGSRGDGAGFEPPDLVGSILYFRLTDSDVEMFGLSCGVVSEESALAYLNPKQAQAMQIYNVRPAASKFSGLVVSLQVPTLLLVDLIQFVCRESKLVSST